MPYQGKTWLLVCTWVIIAKRPKLATLPGMGGHTLAHHFVEQQGSGN